MARRQHYGLTPVPDSDTVCGLVGTLSSNLSAPASEPSCVGVKVTLTWHVMRAGSVVPHVFAEIAKSALIVMPLMSRVAVPMLVNVTDPAALVVLRAWLPKLSELGESVTLTALFTSNWTESTAVEYRAVSLGVKVTERFCGPAPGSVPEFQPQQPALMVPSVMT